MFWHNFKYTFKILLKNKSLIFWTFAFPLIMGLLFNVAFSDIDKSEKFDAIDIAIVENEELNKNNNFKEIIDTLSAKDNENRIFNTKYVTIDKANSLLKDGKITGYLLFEEENLRVVVTTNGISETILKSVVDEIRETLTITNELIATEIKNVEQPINYEELYQKVSNIMENSEANIKDISNDNLSYIIVEFFTLIAMTCLYGGVISMEAMNYSLANMSSQGKRISVSPTKKGKMVLSSLLASFIVQLAGIFLLLIFIILVLKVDFESNMLLVILLSIIGSFAGLTLGLFVAVLFKTNENSKVGMIIAISMAFSFLSGMMGVTMKYIIDKNIPILNKINPANMITDAFYSLYYYDTLDRYIFNVGCLCVFAILLLIISGIILRRQKYDSI